MDGLLDRVSGFPAAGIPSKNTNKSNNSTGVSACLLHEVTEDEKHFCKAGPLDYKLPPPSTNIYRGFNTDVKECLQPDSDKSFFQLLRREFQDTVYDSYWKRPVGKTADPTPTLPAGMDPNAIFGKVTPKDIPAGEIVNPKKSYLEVMEEARIGHEMYKNTHNDYDPGEQTDRHYGMPFKKDLVWGTPTPCDPQGRCMKKVMTLGANDKIFVSKILADHRTRNRSLVGKVLAPNNNIECVPKGHAFGKLNKREPLGAGELMKECPPSLDKVDLHEELCHVNTLRQQTKKHKLSHRDLIDAFHSVDVKKTGYLSKENVYQVLSRFAIKPDRALFESLMFRLKVFCPNGMVAYEKLADVLNVNGEFPNIPKIEDVPKEVLNFETTNQIAHKYHCTDEIDSMKAIPRAGIPPVTDESISEIISPSVFSSYGLTPEDFTIPRSAAYLRTLVNRIGCRLDKDTFCKVWESAKDSKGCVSIQSFLNALEKFK
ncbi:EF-hand domain-containing family member B-like [Macrosteles quadrilineatus]|uniref:EF-hand domain-containing family member B-like n=1 Tax=Macrosteles quadrilineatus TaxID=74068 RepID=UPI0023E3177C|nr:EF-hand domain-containing family member B-like [Macrosteles quadrilineatus]